MTERKVAIVTDGAADLPKDSELQFRYQIDHIPIVPLNVSFGTKNYKSGVGLGTELFIKLIDEERAKGSGIIPKTAAPNEFDFCEQFETFVRQDLDVISVNAGSNLSNTVQVANVAAENFSNRVSVCDTGTVSMAQGLQAIMAEKMAADGASRTEILEFLEDIKSRITLRAVTPNIPFLRESGRVSHLTSIFGQVLKIIPIIQIDHSQVKISGIVRRYGSDELKITSRAKDWMVDDYLKRGNRPQHIAILDLGVKEVADELKEKVIQETNLKEKDVYRGDLGAVTGSHGGPGTWVMITLRQK